MKVVWVTDPRVYGVGCFKVSNLFSYMFKLGEVPKYRSQILSNNKMGSIVLFKSSAV